ncbi:MAG: hypothetical protein Ta2A_14780 [Treponemataceae bacterium]|nr:MAG: hypothetical protein Ta2A_14780 [Treponemataceae bacterium]
MSKALVVLDTNVIVSAFITASGKPARILRMVLERRFDLCYNSIIIMLPSDFLNVHDVQ